VSEQETLTLTSENWQRVKQALDAALEAPAAERATVLERLLGEDPELCRRAEAYLDLEDELGDFIETPAASLSPAGARDGLLGRRIGPYKVLELLGRGGMGAVYLAVREDDYEKRVALKLMHQGLGRGAMVDRFRRERQILARLEHPNIARLLDGGTTEDGSPYLVMEYVAWSSSARCAPRSTSRTATWWSTATSSRATSW
jgi:serine/threonine protein kinase